MLLDWAATEAVVKSIFASVSDMLLLLCKMFRKYCIYVKNCFWRAVVKKINTMAENFSWLCLNLFESWLISQSVAPAR